MQQLGINWPAGAPLSVGMLVINLAVGVVLALALRWHFERFGSTLSNRSEFAQVFPFILLTTVLIISVVKSSLALSLGLVGALSIVRFRTPIKEPEELAYLFMAIAMGLGLGADQLVPTVVASAIILAVIGLLRRSRQGKEPRNLYLSLEWQTPDSSEQPIRQLQSVIPRGHVPCGQARWRAGGDVLRRRSPHGQRVRNGRRPGAKLPRHGSHLHRSESDAEHLAVCPDGLQRRRGVAVRSAACRRLRLSVVGAPRTDAHRERD